MPFSRHYHFPSSTCGHTNIRLPLPAIDLSRSNFFLSISGTPQIALIMYLSVIRKITISSCFKQHISLQTELLNPPTSCSGSHSSLTYFTCTQSPTKIYEFFTTSTSSLSFSSCFTAPSILPSHFQHVNLPENIGGTHFTLAHLPWIHLPRCTHNTELALTLKLQFLFDNHPL